MTTTNMARETAECPAVLRKLHLPQIGIGKPAFAITCGRGSSGNAALLLRYLLETRLGLVVSESAPSTVALMGARLSMRDAIHIAISQSGRSPDLVAAVQAAARSGARTIAIVNAPDSPLAHAAWQAIDIGAGEERSVAATKSVVASMAVAAGLVAQWSGDAPLASAIERLPERLSIALRLDWSRFFDAACRARCVFVVARGFGLAVAREISLKISETLLVPSVSYSAAEFMHGPIAGVGAETPVLCLKAGDETDASVAEVVARLRELRKPVETVADTLPWIGTDHPATDPVAMLVPAYLGIEAAARKAGLDPDRPPTLRKVTMTL